MTSWTVRAAPSQYGAQRPSFGYTVNAGDEITDGIEILNQGTEPVKVKIYPADGFTTAAGSFDLLPEEQHSQDVGTWVKPAVSSVMLAVGQIKRVPFSLAVPANATPGDHVGGIATVLDHKSDGASAGTAAHDGASLPIKVRVSGAVSPQLKIESAKLDVAGATNPFGTGATTISYTVDNTGNTVLSGLQKVTVTGALGLSTRTFDGNRLPDLLPGERWQVRMRVNKVHGLFWGSAKVTVTPVSTDAASSTSTLAPITVSDRSVLSMGSFVLLAVAPLMVVAFAWLLNRLVYRRRSASKAGPDASIPAAVEEG